tara:strand:+ start:999 stop:1295 length:297 start_codon:yes stop_codon:yes gene_type:complete
MGVTFNKRDYHYDGGNPPVEFKQNDTSQFGQPSGEVTGRNSSFVNKVNHFIRGTGDDPTNSLDDSTLIKELIKENNQLIELLYMADEKLMKIKRLIEE